MMRGVNVNETPPYDCLKEDLKRQSRPGDDADDLDLELYEEPVYGEVD